MDHCKGGLHSHLDCYDVECRRSSVGQRSDPFRWTQSFFLSYIWYIRPITGTFRDRSDLCIEYSAWMYVGVNSVITSAIVVGLVSQLWLRKRHPGWYKKYNYILGGALDGGAQVMIFILSFAVFGASGVGRPFPTVSDTTL